jgi:hypothetical protein
MFEEQLFGFTHDERLPFYSFPFLPLGDTHFQYSLSDQRSLCFFESIYNRRYFLSRGIAIKIGDWSAVKNLKKNRRERRGKTQRKRRREKTTVSDTAPFYGVRLAAVEYDKPQRLRGFLTARRAAVDGMRTRGRW